MGPWQAKEKAGYRFMPCTTRLAGKSSANAYAQPGSIGMNEVQLRKEWQLGLTRRPEETEMLNSSQNRRHAAPKRCAICDGPFGLIRHYSWRTPLCSKKCVERLEARREENRNWLLMVAEQAWRPGRLQ